LSQYFETSVLSSRTGIASLLALTPQKWESEQGSLGAVVLGSVFVPLPEFAAKYLGLLLVLLLVIREKLFYQIFYVLS